MGETPPPSGVNSRSWARVNAAPPRSRVWVLGGDRPPRPGVRRLRRRTSRLTRSRSPGRAREGRPPPGAPGAPDPFAGRPGHGTLRVYAYSYLAEPPNSTARLAETVDLVLGPNDT